MVVIRMPCSLQASDARNTLFGALLRDLQLSNASHNEVPRQYVENLGMWDANALVRVGAYLR